MEQQNNQCVMHSQICNELTEIYRKKNHDYGDSYHKSFQKWGWPMAAIRLEDKLNRFETLIKRDGEVKDETMRDTLLDLANYSIMAILELDEERSNW